MDLVKVILAVVLVFALGYIAVTQISSWKTSMQQDFYVKGANDGITARNVEIFNDLQKNGYTVLTLTNGTESQSIVLVPQTA